MTRKSHTARYVPLLASDLCELGACQEQVTAYARAFPEGATPDDADRVIKAGFDPTWLANTLDQAQYRAVRQPAWAQYEAVEQPAWAQYEAVEQPALAQYQAVQQPALAQYQAVQQPAWAQYQAVEQPAWAQYRAVAQPAWAQYQAVREAGALAILRACWPVWEGDV